MTVAQFEESRARGAAVEIYLFRFGTEPTAFHAYCDVEFPVTVDGVTYEPLPIQRAQITSQQSLDKADVDVKVPMTSEIAGLFSLLPPSTKVTLVIRRGQADDPDQEFPVIFAGHVQQSSRDGRTATLRCVPASVSIKRVGLRRHYQYTCPHVLYDQDPGSCRANKAAVTQLARPVTAITSNRVTLAAGWNGAPATSKYVGGMVEWDGPYGRERRTIIRVSGNVLSLSGLPSGLSVGNTVDVVPGCNHQTEDCATLHNNIVNFGGMPYIPTENPVKRNPFT